jgi:SpoVK/Ycf46/Vps4 family AAA+-type ATPase
VDKYIGETEKNLDRIFTEATRVNGVLLFDEADALFGKRSDVADAHDRYANIETAYLLQRMETFDGVAILATNLMANLDDAFSRRLDSLIEFPFPDAEQRLQLWDHCFSGRFPVDGVDLEFCAEAFPLSGGNIRNIVVAAAFFTAADPDAKGIGMPQVIRAVEREYAKLGRMCIAEEFGPYHHLVATP